MNLFANGSVNDTETHPFLAGMKPQHLETLAACAMPAHFGAGEVIFRKGDIANRFYLIENGGVALETKVDRVPLYIESLAAGDVLGWSWLYEPYVWHFDAITFATTDAIFFYGTRLREICETDHELGYELMKRLSKTIIDRLESTQRELMKRALLSDTPFAKKLGPH
jgi:CRP/FNR family cyclic AMP-dependent transcriptional regulator